jgi:hypothetical protein
VATIKQALFSRLTTDAGIAAVVGARCYPEAAPQEAAYPRITYQRIGQLTHQKIKGRTGLVTESLQIDCWAKAATGAANAAEELAALVATRLAEFPWTAGGIYVQAARIQDSRDLSELEAEGGEQWTRRVAVDVTLSYTLA